LKESDDFCQDSLLRIHYTFSKSQWIAHLSDGIAAVTDRRFFSSDSSLNFGPMDITEAPETEDGQEDVMLVDVAQFTFSHLRQLHCGSRYFDESLKPSSRFCGSATVF
jgi:hypothetical protein